MCVVEHFTLTDTCIPDSDHYLIMKVFKMGQVLLYFLLSYIIEGDFLISFNMQPSEKFLLNMSNISFMISNW